MDNLNHFPPKVKPDGRYKNPTPVKEFGGKKELSPEAKIEKFVKTAQERIPGDDY
jgi:hypothetical protein